MKPNTHTRKHRLEILFGSFILFLTTLVMNAQTVTFNPLPTINCPSGNITICGNYTPPTNGGPYSVVSSIELTGPGGLVSGGNQYITTLTATTFCLTIPITLLNGSPFGNYEMQIELIFTQINAPFTVFQVSTTGGSNPAGVDIFYSNTCPIIANDDNTTINQCIGGNMNVLSNDFVNGNPATLSNVVIAQLTASPNVTFNTATGIASVPAGTNPGTYNISYQICSSINPTQCDPAIVSFIVAPQPVVAVNDTFSVSGCTGGGTTSVLINDTLCGISFSNPVNVSFVGAVPVAGATISNAGIISIPAGTIPGSYTFTYNVCHVNAPTSCSNTAAVIINVTNPPIIANADNFPAIIDTLTGGFTLSVLTNDTVNGAPATSSNVTTAIFSSSPTIVGLTINSSGIIAVPVGLTVGNYTIVYSITQTGCASNVAYGSVTITVGSNENTPDIVAGIRANSIVSLVDTQSDNKIIIVGYFTQYNSIGCISIARLKSDLTIDNLTGFNTTGPLPLAVGPFGGGKQVPLAMKVLKNNASFDRILLVGSFTGFSGSLNNGTGIARLLPDGNIDETFNNGVLAPGVIRGVSGSNSQIRTFYVYPDTDLNGNAGKIIIGGMFESYNGLPAYKLARLFPNGTLDAAFSANINANGGFNSAPQAIEVQADGRIIVGGYFSQFNGAVKNNILRLLNSGLIDPSFNGNVLGTHIQKILIQPDQKIIIAGFFSKYNNVSRNSIARLINNNINDGSLDTSFDPGAGFFPVFLPNTSYGSEPPGMIRSIVFEPAVGATPLKLYVSGNFTQYKGLTVPKVILINCPPTIAGGRDNTFRVGPNLTSGGPNNYVWSMKKQGSKLILGGEFTSYNGLSALRVTRIFPTFNNVQSNELRGGSPLFYDSEPEIDMFNSTGTDLVISPNPSTGIFTFNNLNFENENVSIIIYNSLGQKVYYNDVKFKNGYAIDLSNLEKGVYFSSFKTSSTTIKKTLIIN